MRSIPRVLFVAWQNPWRYIAHPIARLAIRDGAPRYEFTYVAGVHDAMRHGCRWFHEPPDLHRAYLLDALPPLLTCRVMSRKRPDYADYIERLGLHGVPPPDLQLARNEGRRVTDRFEVVAPPEFDAAAAKWTYHTFVRGVRHVDGAEDTIRSLRVGQELRLERATVDEFGTRALLVFAGEAHVGYIRAILVEDIERLMDVGAAVRVLVVKMNLPPAGPLHNRLLIAIEAEQHPGFAPLSTQRYQLLAPDAMRIDLARGAADASERESPSAEGRHPAATDSGSMLAHIGA